MAPQTPNQITLPPGVAQDLEARAKKAGLSLPAYLAFLSRVQARGHDNEFVNAAKFLFSKYPNALRKLAQ